MFRRLLPLSIATFAVGTDGFVIAGILIPVARSLHVSIAAAGQLITAFAITYAVAAPVMGALTTSLDRKKVLVGALLVFAAGNAVTAVSPTYALVFAGRVLTAVGAGVITSTASSVAAATVTEAQRGRALSIVMGGLTAATALGVPLGTWIGGTSWRATLWLVVVLSLVAAAGVVAFLPALKLPAAGLRQRLAMLADRRVLGILAVTLVTLSGANTMSAYLAPAVAPVTGGNSGTLTVVFWISGLAAVASTALAGRLTDARGPVPVLLGGLSGLTVILALGPLLITSLPLTMLWVAAWGLVGWLTVVPQQHRLVALAPEAAPVLLGLNASALYLGIALGGVIGGTALHWADASRLGYVAGALVAVSLLIALATTRRGAVRERDLVLSER
ncbi:MFS transporter [Sphaerisporangium fuscum]|uniref:MFS transporter n=1 Tax=Sphaerisporangium fuscum TaxID=2835868 RepID=UPI001BDD5FD1|nr:MFS transporter [Sphaerisporangium fuscum]